MRTTWNLGLLYSGHEDPQIEKDVRRIEIAFSKFERRYRGKTDYLKNESRLLSALCDFEALLSSLSLARPVMYFHYCTDLNSQDAVARAKSSIYMQRLAKNDHKIVFFELSLAKIPANMQKKFLKSRKLEPYRYYLRHTFDRAKHNLSEPEEKIMGLKSITSYQQWLELTNKLLGKQTVTFSGKEMSLAEAGQKISDLPLPERRDLHEKVMRAYGDISDSAESELNAVITDKKINDELRGYEKPYDATILSYQNDRKSVLALVDAVTKNFAISHRFYKLKARLLGLSKLEYSDRAVGIESKVKQISFDEAVSALKGIFKQADPVYLKIFEEFLEKGQIDVFPKIGKTGGAYCSPIDNGPTFVLLNFTDTLDQVFVLAHEMGHAIHTELSKPLGAFYRGYSISTAEVASTFFESLAFDSIYEKATEEEKIGLLHRRINDDIQTIFRQIACFNFEVELHERVRESGGLTSKEISALLVKHMSSYLGPIVEMKEHDGNQFVSWWHIRTYFYVYSYAFGLLISKALYERYTEDKGFIKKIDKFLKAGGTDSPENIFKSIGIDVRKPDFWEKGLKSIEKDIEKLEKLTKNR